MESLEGHLLIACPQLLDPNFVRTVVLLVQHGHDGAFGLVLNRPLNKTVSQLWEQVQEPPCACQQHINAGGPVSGPLMALHTFEDLSELQVVPGVFFSAEKTHLEELVRRDGGQFKLFVGHSGWGGRQLESELKQGAWRTMPAKAEYIFLDEEAMWPRISGEIGRSLLQDILKLKDLPEDPTVN